MNDDDKKKDPVKIMTLPSDEKILKMFKDAHKQALENGEGLILVPDLEAIWTGFAITGDTEEERAVCKGRFWRAKCPCGEEGFVPLNGIPEEETPWPCANPNHWLTKHFSKSEQEKGPEKEPEKEPAPKTDKEAEEDFDLSKIPTNVVN